MTGRLRRTSPGGVPRIVDLLRHKTTNQDTILARAYSRLANRQTTAAPVLWLGSSTTAGQGASTFPNTYVGRVNTALQQRWPNSGAEPAIQSLGAAPPATGVVSYNAGLSGSDSASFLSDARLAQVAAVPFALINIMIGTNDSYDRNPVLLKANIRYWLDRLQAALPATPIVVHRSFARMDRTGPYTWAQYGAVFAELAAEDSTRVLYRDEAPVFEARGVPGADPDDLISSDNLHATDAGHALLGAQVFAGIDPSARRPAGSVAAPPLENNVAPFVTGTPSVGSTLAVTDGTWSQTGITFFRQWWRDGVLIPGQTGASYTLVSADAGKRIDAHVIVTKAGYASASRWVSTQIAA